MSLRDIPVHTLDDAPTTFGEVTGDRAALVVNVASKCGLTPQYAGLVRLQERFGEQGFTVVGVPCNQFMGQEPGSAEEIQQFCVTTYGVDFPLLEKIEVNGENRHPLYTSLVSTPDETGEAGDIQWNFEKFLLDREGNVVARFRPGVQPEDPAVVAAVEKAIEKAVG